MNRNGSMSTPTRKIPTEAEAERLLRDELKVALQDAKDLFDTDLLDEREFKDLKAHEIRKYKDKLALLSPPASSPATTASPTPVRTPEQPPRPPPVHPFRTPPSAPARPRVVYLDPSAYYRLSTPPIFRRRTAHRRRIRLPSSELRKLQEARGGRAPSG